MKKLSKRAIRRIIAAGLVLALVLAWPVIRFKKYPLGFRRSLYYSFFVSGYGELSTPTTQTVFRELRDEYKEIQAIRSYMIFGDVCVGVSINTDGREAVDKVAAGVQARLTSEPFFSEFLKRMTGRSVANMNLMIHRDYGQEQLYCSSMFYYTDAYYWGTNTARPEDEEIEWDGRYPEDTGESEQYFREHFA